MHCKLRYGRTTLPRKRKDVEAALERKGFARVEGNHHFFIYLTRDGLKTRAKTKTSHSPKVREIDDGILREMAWQCLLTKPDFLKLVDCPMSRDDYERKLTDLGEV